MNQGERWLKTLLFGKPDRVPLSPGGGRKSTRARWHSEGLPVEIDDMNDINEYAYRISGGKEKWPRPYRTYRANASGSKGLVSSKTVYDLCGQLLRHTGRSRCDIYPSYQPDTMRCSYLRIAQEETKTSKMSQSQKRRQKDFTTKTLFKAAERSY